MFSREGGQDYDRQVKELPAYRDAIVAKITEAAHAIPAGTSLSAANAKMAEALNVAIADARTHKMLGATIALSKVFNSQFASRNKSSANAAPQYLEQAAKQAGLSAQAKLDAAHLFMQGKKVDLAIGMAKDKQTGGTGKVSLADVYTNKANRIGPEPAGLKTQQQAELALLHTLRVSDIKLG